MPRIRGVKGVEAERKSIRDYEVSVALSVDGYSANLETILKEIYGSSRRSICRAEMSAESNRSEISLREAFGEIKAGRICILEAGEFVRSHVNDGVTLRGAINGAWISIEVSRGVNYGSGYAEGRRIVVAGVDCRRPGFQVEVAGRGV